MRFLTSSLFVCFFATALPAGTLASPQPAETRLEQALEAFRLWSLGLGNSIEQIDLMQPVFARYAGDDPRALCATATLHAHGHLREIGDADAMQAARSAASREIACPSYLAKSLENTADGGYDGNKQWAFDAVYRMALEGNVEAAASMARYVLSQPSRAPYWLRTGKADAPQQIYSLIQRAPDSSPHKWQALHYFCGEVRWSAGSDTSGEPWIDDLLSRFGSSDRLDSECARYNAMRHATAYGRDWRAPPYRRSAFREYSDVFEALYTRQDELRRNLNAVGASGAAFRIGSIEQPTLELGLAAGELVFVVPGSSTTRSGRTWVEVYTTAVDFSGHNAGISGWVPEDALIESRLGALSSQVALENLDRQRWAIAVAELAVLASHDEPDGFYGLGMAAKHATANRAPDVAERTNLAGLRGGEQQFFQEAAQRGHRLAQVELASYLHRTGNGNTADIAYWYGRAWASGLDLARGPALQHARRLPIVSVSVSAANLRSRPTSDSEIVGGASAGTAGYRLATRQDWVLALWPSVPVVAWVSAPLVQVE